MTFPGSSDQIKRRLLIRDFPEVHAGHRLFRVKKKKRGRPGNEACYSLGTLPNYF